MNINISTQRLLNILLVIIWIIFIGLCIEAGGFLFNTLYAIFYKPIAAERFWNNISLSSLLQYDKGFFVVFTGIVCLVAILKALMFYLILRLLSKKKFIVELPFSTSMKNLIAGLAYICIGIAFFSNMAVKYNKWFKMNGVTMPDIQELKLSSADVWLFMAIILIVISQIIKRGIELQTENDLTI